MENPNMFTKDTMANRTIKLLILTLIRINWSYQFRRELVYGKLMKILLKLFPTWL